MRSHGLAGARVGSGTDIIVFFEKRATTADQRRVLLRLKIIVFQASKAASIMRGQLR
jgi:hypothetical protein